MYFFMLQGRYILKKVKSIWTLNKKSREKRGKKAYWKWIKWVAHYKLQEALAIILQVWGFQGHVWILHLLWKDVLKQIPGGSHIFLYVWARHLFVIQHFWQTITARILKINKRFLILELFLPTYNIITDIDASVGVFCTSLKSFSREGRCASAVASFLCSLVKVSNARIS